ncbi:unnamed protein product, partial [Tilletia laevis]
MPPPARPRTSSSASLSANAGPSSATLDDDPILNGDDAIEQPDRILENPTGGRKGSAGKNQTALPGTLNGAAAKSKAKSVKRSAEIIKLEREN